MSIVISGCGKTANLCTVCCCWFKPTFFTYLEIICNISTRELRHWPFDLRIFAALNCSCRPSHVITIKPNHANVSAVAVKRPSHITRSEKQKSMCGRQMSLFHYHFYQPHESKSRTCASQLVLDCSLCFGRNNRGTFLFRFNSNCASESNTAELVWNVLVHGAWLGGWESTPGHEAIAIILVAKAEVWCKA